MIRRPASPTPALFAPGLDDPHPCPVYLASLTLLGGHGQRSFGTMKVLAHTFGPREQARATIGRDILRSCFLNYDGPLNRFTLAF